MKSFGAAELAGHTKRYCKIRVREIELLRRCAGPAAAPGTKVITGQAGGAVISNGDITEGNVITVDVGSINDCRRNCGACCPHR